MQAGNYSIKQLVIMGEKISVNLSAMFTEINIFESIYSASLTGWVTVNDALNLISGSNSLPIMGNEVIIIEVSVGEHVSQQPGTLKKLVAPKIKNIVFVGRVIDVKNRTIINERSQSYEIHFVSEEFVLDRNIRISKSFTNLKVHDIVEKVFSEFGIPDTYEFEKTVRIANVVIPNWTPLKTINWLASRAISETYNTPTFFFFQTLYNDGPTSGDRPYTKSRYTETTSNKFWFLSLDDMLAYDARKKIYFRPGNVGIDTRPPDLAYEFANAYNYEVMNSFNTLTNNANGLYNSTLISHDITTKTWKKTVFNYDDGFDKLYHLETNKMFSGVTDSKGNRFNSKNYKESLIIYNPTGTLENPNYTENISSIRTHSLAS